MRRSSSSPVRFTYLYAEASARQQPLLRSLSLHVCVSEVATAISKSKVCSLGVISVCRKAGNARSKARMLKLTRVVFNALQQHGLVPFEAQRVVIDARRGVGTAIDLLCQRGQRELVLVELKCGFAGDRTRAAAIAGAPQRMRAPLRTASDCLLHRHFAQLAVTWGLLVAEKGTLQALRALGVQKRIGAALLYVNDDTTELHELPVWWTKRASKLIEALGR